MVKWQHIQGLDGRQQNILEFLTSESGSTKKWFAIAHENRRNGVYVRFEASLIFKMGLTVRETQSAA